MNLNLLGALGVVFITLKLLGYITWSWVWVLAPLWIPTALIVSTLIWASIKIVKQERG